jgi:hypothetical protein
MADNPILTNVDFSFRRGPKSDLNNTAMQNGSLNICTDTDELFADIDGRRIPLSGIIIYDTESEIFALTDPEPVLYYAKNTKIVYWIGGSYTINVIGDDYTTSYMTVWYAENGLPYRYNITTRQLEMIDPN